MGCSSILSTNDQSFKFGSYFGLRAAVKKDSFHFWLNTRLKALEKPPTRSIIFSKTDKSNGFYFFLHGSQCTIGMTLVNNDGTSGKPSTPYIGKKIAIQNLLGLIDTLKDERTLCMRSNIIFFKFCGKIIS